MMKGIVRLFLIAGTVACMAAESSVAAVSPNDAAFTAAQREFKQGRFNAAKTHFASFATKYPEDPHAAEAMLLQGICEMKLKQPADAIKTWTWLIQRYATSPKSAEAMEHLAAYYQSKANPAAANQWRQKLATQFPDHPIAVNMWTARGGEAFKAGQYAEAVKAYEKVEPKLSPSDRQSLEVARHLLEGGTNPDGLLDAATARLKANDTEGAKGLYTAYVQKYPNAYRTAEAKTQLGWCYYVSGKNEDTNRAAQLWQEVIKAGPPTSNWVGQAQWHTVQYLSGPARKWKDAAALCVQISKTFPPGSFRHEQALYSRAWLFWVKKQWPEALTAFQELIKAYPEKAGHPPIVYYLEDCHKHVGKAGSE